MIAIYLSLVALAAAAPHYNHRPHFHNHNRDFDYGFGEDLFDVGKFWQELAVEMRKMDEVISELSKHFPTATSCNEGVEGNEYKLTISLTGFDEKDIAVKAKEGVLMIQAVHNTPDGNQKSYIDLRTLPAYVNLAGSWTYDKKVLKIVFPLKRRPVGEVTTVSPPEGDTTLAAGDQNREEVEQDNNNENVDADVGLRGDRDKEEIETNEISNNAIEATTYAVDLKNEVEFVPMKYRK